MFETGMEVQLKEEAYELVKRQRTQGKIIIFEGTPTNIPISIIDAYREKTPIKVMRDDGRNLVVNVEGRQYRTRCSTAIFRLVNDVLREAVDL